MAKPKSLISNDIKLFRHENGEMTQQELADLVGLTRQTVNAIEGAKYSPTLEIAFKIAQVFNTSVERVFRYGKSD